MEKKELFAKLKQAIFDGESEVLTTLVKESIDSVEALELIEKGMMPGMKEVGDKFSAGEVYLPELLMAAEAWEEAMKIIKPKLIESGASLERQGVVVLGTVQNDIHEIGKNIVANLFTTAGFEVHDVGCDCPATKFLAKAEEVSADIIAASAIMSTTVPYQKDIVDLLDSKGMRDKYLVMVGGGVVSREWADSIGADGYGELASDAVQVARELIVKKKGA